MALSIKDIVTPQYLKDTVILGVDLTLDDGSEYPDALFTAAVEQAVAILENELGFTIDPRMIKGERHDADIQDRTAFYPIHLDTLPLRKVDALSIQIGTAPAATLPVAWVTVNNHQTAKFNVIPTSSTVGSVYFRSGIPLLVGDVFSPYAKFPSYFSVDYTAGFTFEEGSFTFPAGESAMELTLQETYNLARPNITFDSPNIKVVMTGPTSAMLRRSGDISSALEVNYSANDVDPAIIKSIAILASLLPLDVAGDLVAGAGIAAKSISLDALSQQINTTSSATNAGYSARVKQFERELKSTLASLRAKYSRINFWAR